MKITLCWFRSALDLLHGWLHHKLNPLHVYCRCSDLKIFDKCVARLICENYEIYIYKAFLSKTIDLIPGYKSDAGSLEDEPVK